MAMTLQIVRTSVTSAVSESHDVQVDDQVAAHKVLGWYAHDTAAVTGYLTGPDGSWHGSGVAGGGRVVSGWVDEDEARAEFALATVDGPDSVTIARATVNVARRYGVAVLTDRQLDALEQAAATLYAAGSDNEPLGVLCAQLDGERSHRGATSLALFGIGDVAAADAPLVLF